MKKLYHLRKMNYHKNNYWICTEIYRIMSKLVVVKTYGVLEVLLNTKKFEYAINAKEKTLSFKHAICCLETISQGVN